MHDDLADLVVERGFERVVALRAGEFRMGVVDVEPGSVGEDGVDQRPFGVGDSIALVAEAAGITPG